MSWGHTDRLLWQHFSLSCDPRSGLSSLHRWTPLDGLLTYLCLPDIVLSSRSTGVTPGVQSCKTLTRGFASLILGKRMTCVHSPFCPVVCITETTPFVLSWKVTGLKLALMADSSRKRAEYSTKSPCVIFMVEFCSLFLFSPQTSPPRSCVKTLPRRFLLET